MPQLFLTQLEQICRRRRRRRWLAATCWAVAALLVAALVMMGLDRVLGIADPVGRTLVTVLLVAMGTMIARRWFLTITAIRVTPLQVAQEVERRHAALRDVVSSAWEFSRQPDDDPTAGSESLRRAIVLRAATSVDEVDWQQLVPREPLRLAALGLASVGLTLGVLTWNLPEEMKIGFTRLMNPRSSAEWPRDHDLHFVEPPTLLAAGEELILQLHDTHGALPAAITMHYRTRSQGRWLEETQSLAASENSLQIRLPNVRQALQYRATGGDHRTMPWHSLEVEASPRVEQLTVTVHPPAYTQRLPQPWEKSTKIYPGSGLELRGNVDRPVTQAVLAGTEGEIVATQLSPDGLSFRIEHSDWRIDRSGTYSPRLTTETGLTTRAAVELALEVVADRPPIVRLIEPVVDLVVLPTVAVPLVIEATDELALREIELVYRRSDRPDEGEQKLSLWKAESNTSSVANVRRHQVSFLWQLEKLSLPTGSVVEVRARASDAQPSTGQTVRALRIFVVSEEELWRQIVQQQTHVVEILVQLLGEQRELLGVTARWAELPDWSSARWANASHGTLFRQRRIADMLAEGQDSVIGQLAGLLQTIRRNGLVRPAALDRLHVTQELLQSLVEQPLAVALDSLGKVVRQSRRSADRQVLEPLFVTLAQQQEQTASGLSRALDLLLPGNIAGRLERELMVMESDQKKLAAYCGTKIAPKLLELDATSAATQAALSDAVRQQRDLARRLARWTLDLAQAAKRITDDEPALATRLDETGLLAKDLELQATIQAAADQLAQRRPGRSAVLQQQTLVDLAKLRARLAGQDAKGSAERFKRLQAVERQLHDLRRQVAALQRELRQLTADQPPHKGKRLERQREKLAAQTEAIARKLERLRIPRAAKPTSEAASQLRRNSLDPKNVQQAKQQLDTAQRQLTTERRRQQVALARLQMAQLQAKLGGYMGRQQSIQEEILRLEILRKAADQLNRAQEQQVSRLAVRQAGLSAEVRMQADAVSTLPVFAHLMKSASETMQNIEGRLRQAKLGQPTPAWAEQAIDQLTQLAKVLRQERKNLSASNRGQGGAGQGTAGDKPQEQTLQLALGQLQLLKSLQVALQEKTQTLETQQTAGQPAIISAQELARQQQQLTELARQLVSEPPDPPAEPLDEIMLPRVPEEIQP